MAKPKGKTSRVKIGNKSSNKKNRGGGMNKQIEKFQSAKLNAGKTKVPEKFTKNKMVANKLDYSRRYHQQDEDDDVDVDDMPMSDDDMKTYLTNNAKNISFLSQNLSQTKSGPKNRRGRDLHLYEVTPRSSSKLYTSVEQNDDHTRLDLLPIKSATGIIRRKADRLENEEKDVNSEEEQEEEEMNEGVEEEALSVIEIVAAHREQVNQKKLEIAQLSIDIVENPYEKISQVKHLLKLAEKNEAMTIRKLSLLSILEIFKDVIPSYHIREMSDEEQNSKVSKDVKKIRDYEQGLLKLYQQYLQVLEDNIKSSKNFVKKSRGKGVHHEKQKKALVGLVLTSIKCMAELIKQVPHFNFRKNIISVLVPNIELSNDLHEAGQICFKAIKETLYADYAGYISLDVVSIIQHLAKTKPTLNPLVLETLLCLRVKADLIRSTEEKGNKIERLKAKQEAIKKMSRKEKKRKKVEDKLNVELQEAEAVENQDKVGKTHTEILKRLFVVYFRVLKLGFKSDLLSVTLRGLARFSHLINIDFFGDLMNCLEVILKHQALNTQDRLNCILTALKVLSGQGEALTIDPRQFYTELYNLLLNFNLEMASTCFDSVKECLEIMLIKRRKQVSHPQILGFLKRLSTIMLQIPAEKSSHVFMLLRSILQLYEKCDYLLDNENFGRGVFQPELTNPEHCHADSTALWELQLLSKCFHGDAEVYCKHIIAGAPSHGPGALPQKYLNRGSSSSSSSSSTATTGSKQSRQPKNADTTSAVASAVVDYFQGIPEQPQVNKKVQQGTTNRFLIMLRKGNDNGKYTELCKTVDNDTEQFLLNGCLL